MPRKLKTRLDYRVPEETKLRLEAQAEIQGRSMTSLIVEALAAICDHYEKSGPPPRFVLNEEPKSDLPAPLR